MTAGGPPPDPRAVDTDERPFVLVWEVTQACELACEHCRANAKPSRHPDELTTAEGERLLDELAEYGAPVVLFSGGEPLVRADLVELVAHAADAGIRPVLSTNGTLLTTERARRLKDAGLAYAGISVDGLAERNDQFRGVDGAFRTAVEGIETCLEVGLKTGLRYTVTRQNVEDLDGVVDLLTDVGLDRFCFYHLSYSGRGETLDSVDLDAAERRAVVKRICDRTVRSHRDGDEIETLMVGNYADAAYVVEYTRRQFGEAAARRVYARLEPAAIRPANASPPSTVSGTYTRRSSGGPTASETSGIDRSETSGRTTRIRCFGRSGTVPVI